MILVIDGQGGGIGARLISALREAGIPAEQITAVGANALATSAMLKAGAGAGATGENAVLYNAPRAGIILGPVGILLANAMLGEITPAMSAAVSGSAALKILIPSSRCSVHIAGVEPKPMEYYLRHAVELVKAERDALHGDEGGRLS